MAGLAVAKRFGTVPGVIICALAAGVKSPAALGVLFLGWVWAGSRRIDTAAHRAYRARRAHRAGDDGSSPRSCPVPGGAGSGPRRPLTAAFTGVTPINVVARGASILTHVVQVPVSTVDLHPVFSVLGLLVAAYVGYRLLRRAPQDGVVRCLGLTLLVLALLGPIVWAWYVTWGVVVVAPAAAGDPHAQRAHRHQHVLGLRRGDVGPQHLHADDPHVRADGPAPGDAAAGGGHHAARAVLQPWPAADLPRGCRRDRATRLAGGGSRRRRRETAVGRAASRRQSARSSADTTRSGRRRATSSPATPLRAPYSSARSAPM